MITAELLQGEELAYLGSEPRGRELGVVPVREGVVASFVHATDASLAVPGCPHAGLRSHPTNLIRVMPAKGVHDRSKVLDDCRLGLGRRRRDPG